MAAPGRVEVTLERGAVAPGDTAIVRARVRATEFDEESALVTIPSIHARVVGGQGFDEVIRLWPSLELGEFEGRFRAPAAGRYDVHVTLEGSGNSDAVLVVTEGARRAVTSSDALRTVALRTGGVSVDDSDLSPLVAHLRGLVAVRRARGDASGSLTLVDDRVRVARLGRVAGSTETGAPLRL